MNRSFQSCRTRGLFIAAVIISMLSPFADAQEQRPGEFIKRYPPEFLIKNVKKNALELERKMLRWQVQRGEMKQEQLEREMTKLQAEIEACEANAAQIANQSPAELRHASDFVREQLINGALQKLLDARVEIAANEALMEKIDARLQAFKPNEIEQKRFETRENTLRAQLQLLREKAQFLKAMHEQGTTDGQMLREAQIRIEGLEGELAELSIEKQLSTRKSTAELSVRLADVRLETYRLRAREKAAETQLAQLAEAAKVASRIRQEQRTLDELIQRMKLRLEHYERVLMETEEVRQLLKLLEDAMKDAPQPADLDESTEK